LDTPVWRKGDRQRTVESAWPEMFGLNDQNVFQTTHIKWERGNLYFSDLTKKLLPMLGIELVFFWFRLVFSAGRHSGLPFNL
jgi:hypothetical protein